MSVAGLVLAAGAGRRMGTPKALLVDADGTPWVARAVQVLRDGGCDGVSVVLGASADLARTLVPAGYSVVVADDWAQGMGASLRAGLGSLAAGGASAVVVSLVDTPGVTPAVVARLLEVASASGLARAAYSGVPGHPVLLGREHWAGVAASASGDQGARSYLREHPVTLVECGDVGSGEDVDTPPGVGP